MYREFKSFLPKGESDQICHFVYTPCIEKENKSSEQYGVQLMTCHLLRHTVCQLAVRKVPNFSLPYKKDLSVFTAAHRHLRRAN